jgi:hypothetical protein
MVAHSNLIANCTLIHEQFMEMMVRVVHQRVRTCAACSFVLQEINGAMWEDYRQSCTITWLPTFHDMGLIGMFLAPLLGGNLVICFSPLTFIMNPVRCTALSVCVCARPSVCLCVQLVWLREISRHKYVMTAAPPFALDLCCTKAKDADLKASQTHWLFSSTLLAVRADPASRGAACTARWRLTHLSRRHRALHGQVPGVRLQPEQCCPLLWCAALTCGSASHLTSLTGLYRDGGERLVRDWQAVSIDRARTRPLLGAAYGEGQHGAHHTLLRHCVTLGC